MIYGYARTSTKKQKLESQVNELEKLVLTGNIYTEQYSGKSSDRPVWQKLLKKVKNGDTIVFLTVDRMSRSAVEGVSDYFELMDRGITLEFVKQPMINSEIFKSSLNNKLDLVGDDIADIYINATNEVMKVIATKQIITAFQIADDNRVMIIDKVKLGLATTKKVSGRKKGISPTNKLKCPVAKIRKHSKKYNGVLNNTELAKLLGVSRTTLIKWFKELDNENK